jgi:hypothetical protein
MAEFPSTEWMNKYREAVSSDQEMNVVGRFFDADFLLGLGAKEYIMQVRKGKISNTLENPSPLDVWSFAIRGSEESWKKFIQAVPPPMFNDIFAGVFQGNFKLEGDIKVFMQNIRALYRMLDVMREVKASSERSK